MDSKDCLLEITCQSDFASLVSGRKLPIVILSPSTGSPGLCPGQAGQAPRRISADLLTMRFFVALLLRMTSENMVCE